MNRDALVKILHSIIKIPIQFGLAWTLPVIMTTKFYGSYDFVLNAFNRINSLVEGGSLTAFYVEYSKRKEEKLVSFYAILLIGFLFILIFLAGITYKFVAPKIYLDLASYMLTVLQSWNILVLSFLTKMFDARNRTYFIEKFKNATLFITLVILILLVYNPLPLRYVLSIIVLFQFAVTTILLLKNTVLFRLSKEVSLGYLNYIYTFCKPLYIYLIVSVISVLIGRAILQVISVPEEQSYYALAFKFISVVLIILGAAVPILTRALSRLDSLREIKRKTLDSLKAVVFFGLILGLLLYISADKLVLAIGGQEYIQSIEVVRFLVLVPFLQIANQVLGSFHYSLGLTALYSRAGIIASLLGIFWVLLAYLLDAREVFPFNAKMVAITYTLNQLGRFILLYRSFKLSNDKRK